MFSQYRAQSTLIATRPTAIILARCASSPESRLIRSKTASVQDSVATLHLRRYLRFGDVVVLEDQPVALAVVLDEVEERLDRGAQPLAVVGGGAQRLPHAGHQVVDVALQHRQVQLELGREVLVQNGFADARPVGDLVHARRVVAAVDEDLAGGDEQLPASFVAGQSVATPVARGRAARRTVTGPRLARVSSRRRWRDRSSVLNLDPYCVSGRVG